MSHPKVFYLKLKHGLSFVGFQHEAERTDSCVGIICLFLVSLWKFKVLVPYCIYGLFCAVV